MLIDFSILPSRLFDEVILRELLEEAEVGCEVFDFAGTANRFDFTCSLPPFDIASSEYGVGSTL